MKMATIGIRVIGDVTYRDVLLERGGKFYSVTVDAATGAAVCGEVLVPQELGLADIKEWEAVLDRLELA